MNRIGFTVLACVVMISSYAQTATVDLQSKTLSLNDRFLLMKKQAETYQDYKVIKENILDGVWKTESDTLKKRNEQLKAASDKIGALQKEMIQVRTEIKTKEDSMAGILYDSTHISVLGIDLQKKSFLIFFLVSLGLLAAGILFLLARIKVIHLLLSETKVIALNYENELKEFKRSAIDREAKLSRQLQTERNQLVELKESMKLRR